MPELPEVETIARGLAPLLAGRRVAGLDVLDRRAFPGDPEAFLKDCTGLAFTGTGRRGKLLLLELENGGCLAFHLRMTGRVFVARPDAQPHRHLRLLVPLDDGRAIHFQDMRRFGSCRAFGPGELEGWGFVRDLGPEPIGLAPEAFRQALAGRAGRIKALLLDQHVLAGVGNIYADEALFRAGIHPETPADRIAPGKLEALLAALQEVLQRAIEAGGSTIRDYRTAHGVEGSFQWSFQAYGRAGQPCPRCARAMESARVAGRTSTFCRACQPPPAT
ncbi:Formamidopyrimidine-DNA glycosylase [Fundidesulfovibrio magnetotacticus]|uniref:Formamidopyrimidine-DNA glycosylase n=1 Tax=Fundidesulfovibrio magnetotacticus TaxID=2730080 RepID=A0A6V8LM20_9BACT|nr:bifunctional DNA-formamidopyrimidine glycosylase/DNA-(apurinic or apyrimidinic site) lyase [Fundidesulfovibrio magnetotacticus]GFK92754.1 Formamidopyrimidine-DNA glycosylase [Fundidesulfovibrio magnetotacticus]